jgi:H2-forming N5,N10-methylenetetrahydromethanopterin dehydrogenase-like enzyme
LTTTVINRGDDDNDDDDDDNDDDYDDDDDDGVVVVVVVDDDADDDDILSDCNISICFTPFYTKDLLARRSHVITKNTSTICRTCYCFNACQHACLVKFKSIKIPNS